MRERDWQPIESGPKKADYTTVILFCPEPREVIAGYHAAGGWLSQDRVPVTPTHWMPMPGPPAGPGAAPVEAARPQELAGYVLGEAVTPSKSAGTRKNTEQSPSTQMLAALEALRDQCYREADRLDRETGDREEDQRRGAAQAVNLEVATTLDALLTRWRNGEAK